MRVREYLGDGVYGEYLDGELRLYLGDDTDGDWPANEIYINSNTLANLFKFVERVSSVKITVEQAVSGTNAEDSHTVTDNKDKQKVKIVPF
jgi:hypothetical protein